LCLPDVETFLTFHEDCDPIHDITAILRMVVTEGRGTHHWETYSEGNIGKFCSELLAVLK